MSRAVNFTHANRPLIRNMRRTTAAPKIASKVPRPIAENRVNPARLGTTPRPKVS